MPGATYRTKILLAMMGIVSAVSVATLVIAQQRVQQTYERVFRSQFQRQVAFFRTLQDARLGAVKDRCLRLSQSIRLIASLNEADLDAADLYQIAEGELREVLQLPQSRGLPGRQGVRAAFFRFLDATGKIVSPPEESGQPTAAGGMPVRLEKPLALVQEVLAGDQPQQVGYLALAIGAEVEPNGLLPLRLVGIDRPRTGTEPIPTVHEVVVTKVLDPASGALLGALILGFPLPDLLAKLERPGASADSADVLGRMQWGVLLEGSFFAGPDVDPALLGRSVALQVIDQVRASSQAQREFGLETESRNKYRVFCERMTDGAAFPLAHQVCLYSLEGVLREQRLWRWRIIGLGIGGLIVALALSLFISHGLSAPIRALVASTSEIQRGNYQVRIAPGSPNEFGQLASSFNNMAEGLALKEKYRTVLNMVADERIAQRLIDGGLTLGGELREITVLFCDIRGFTALTQNMAPNEIIAMLNEHMTALTGIVKEHHGVLDKFVGDLLMAIFGAPIHHGDDTRNAALCALRLVEMRERLNRTSRHRLQVGIGLATGTVVAGCMGSKDRLNYTVLGGRVNLASRLCARAGPGEVLLDDATYRDLGDTARVRPIGDVQLKGFAAPVQVFRLEAMFDSTSQRQP